MQNCIDKNDETYFDQTALSDTILFMLVQKNVHSWVVLELNQCLSIDYV